MLQSTALPLSYRGIVLFQAHVFYMINIFFQTIDKVDLWYTLVCMPQRRETRTYKDRAEYIKKAVSARRKKLRLMAIEHMGGKCERCGYSKCVRALSFHHRNPKEKNFGVSARGMTRSLEKVKNEIEKCVLLCANCHMELHEEENK
jgi:5-methylcytosine-specific restriction endonuclease McrA